MPPTCEAGPRSAAARIPSGSSQPPNYDPSSKGYTAEEIRRTREISPAVKGTLACPAFLDRIG